MWLKAMSSTGSPARCVMILKAVPSTGWPARRATRLKPVPSTGSPNRRVTRLVFRWKRVMPTPNRLNSICFPSRPIQVCSSRLDSRNNPAHARTSLRSIRVAWTWKTLLCYIYQLFSSWLHQDPWMVLLDPFSLHILILSGLGQNSFRTLVDSWLVESFLVGRYIVDP